MDFKEFKEVEAFKDFEKELIVKYSNGITRFSDGCLVVSDISFDSYLSEVFVTITEVESYNPDSYFDFSGWGEDWIDQLCDEYNSDHEISGTLRDIKGMYSDKEYRIWMDVYGFKSELNNPTILNEALYEVLNEYGVNDVYCEYGSVSFVPHFNTLNEADLLKFISGVCEDKF